MSQLLLLKHSQSMQNPKSTASGQLMRVGHAGINLAAAIFACCVVGTATALQADMQCSASSGLWSTATLSSYRAYTSATSLPNLGLAIVAGGYFLSPSGVSKDVDIYNVTAGRWSTAILSVPRGFLTATSLPNLGLAIFAGGSSNSVTVVASDVVDIFNGITGTWSTAVLSVRRNAPVATSLPNHGIAMIAGGWTGSAHSDCVDIFNGTFGTWSTAVLSVPRSYLAATSLPNLGLAFFAGGYRIDHNTAADAVDIFNVRVGRWSTAVLSVARGFMAATSLSDIGLAIFAGGKTPTNVLNVVDIFNGTSGIWSTAVLSVARCFLAATSLSDIGLAIFAGGDTSPTQTSISNYVDIFNGITKSWSMASLSSSRSIFAATSLPNLGVAIFAGGHSNQGNSVDLLTLCSAGYYFFAGTLSCIPCNAGTFNPSIGCNVMCTIVNIGSSNSGSKKVRCFADHVVRYLQLRDRIATGLCRQKFRVPRQAQQSELAGLGYLRRHVLD
jgi:hypothetical protein